ncbi:MAG: signal peptidase I [Chloroflexi bacterium]|nr:signal peptidase I [Chloroflexota bacterium]
MTFQDLTESAPAPADNQPTHDDIQSNVPQPSIHKGQSFVREFIETVLLIVAIYTFVNLATARFVVDGESMEPNFHTDQFIIVSRLSYILGEPDRGDVVVFHYPEDPSRDFIKRVIGLPGETVTLFQGQIYIDGRLLEEPYIDPARAYRSTLCSERENRFKQCDWELGDDQYFVLGDNRRSSKDSEDFGPVDREYIVGRAFVRYWPLEDLSLISHWEFDNGSSLPLPSVTPTFTPSITPTPSNTPTPSSTPTPTASPLPPSGLQQPDFSPTPTFTPEVTPTPTRTVTPWSVPAMP